MISSDFIVIGLKFDGFLLVFITDITVFICFLVDAIEVHHGEALQQGEQLVVQAVAAAAKLAMFGHGSHKKGLSTPFKGSEQPQSRSG